MKPIAWGVLLLPIVLAGCNGGGGSDGSTATSGNNSGSTGSTGGRSSGSGACPVEQREAELTSALAAAPSEVDFSLSLQRSDGRRYTYNRGAATPDTRYESASTSKLVSAVIILRLVEQGYLKLSDRPQDWIPSWPISVSDPLYNMTLAQLLSFTSGLTSEPLCQNSGSFNFASCVYNIGNNNAGNGIVPGSQFYYASTHLQVAGLMAMRARGVNNWSDLFSEFQQQTGLFPTAAYDLPSGSNPRLAGGMHWSGNEYLAFLNALQAGSLLNAASMQEFLKDRSAAGVTIAYSPARESINEDWHYGFGFWHECQSSSFNCTSATRISSPGAYGAYPFWDRSQGFIGILARQGGLQTYKYGVNTYRAAQKQIDAWAACR